MSDLSWQVREHLAQCHRHDRSEHLLAELVDENDRQREALECLARSDDGMTADIAYSALNGEAASV